MKLIFVYNANEGLAAGVLDSIHKVVSPSTYACDLCALTHGAFRMDPKWRAWLKAQRFETIFYHRPDFRAAYPALAQIRLPVVLAAHGSTMETLISASDFASIRGIDPLIARIEDRLSAMFAREGE